jgi:hypothetical protein
MQAELNKYFYNDITNLILDYHYKTIFNNSIKKMKKEIDRARTRYYDNEEEDDTDDEEDYVDYRENYFISQFINHILYEPKQKRKRRKREIMMKKQEQRVMERIKKLIQ